MPACKRFYDWKFIAQDLDVSKSQAYNILHMFEEQGKATRPDPTGAGRGSRTLRVRATIYENWLNAMDGGEPKMQKTASAGR